MDSDIFFYIDPSPLNKTIDGNLTGKLIVVQSNISVRGWPVNAASTALEQYTALEDATVIERIRMAGGVIKGSTRMSELGFGLKGDTTARSLDETEVDIALMTDTMGEARVTASTKGVFGFKPSYGIVSRAGLIGLVPSMECFGIISKNLVDVAAMMGIIAGPDDKDLSMLKSGIPEFCQFNSIQESIGSIGIVRECIETLESDELKAFNAALSKLKQSGVNIKELNLSDFELTRMVHNIIGSVEASSSAGKYDGVRYGHRAKSAKNWNEMYLKSREESFGLLVKTYLFQGAYFQFISYNAFENACRIRARIVRKTEELFNSVDVLAFPTARSGFNDAVNTINDVYDVFSLTLLANITGLPSVTLPGFVLNKDTDMGLQLVGPHLYDVQLLSSVYQLSHL